MNPYSSALYILGGVSVLLVLVNQAFIFWKNVIKEDPNPARTYRTRPDCVAIHEKDRKWLRNVEKTARVELRKETGDLHDRIDNLHGSQTTQFKEVHTQLGYITGLLEGKKI